MGDEDGKIPEQYAAELADFFRPTPDGWPGTVPVDPRDRDLTATRELAVDLVQDAFEAAARDWKTVRELVPGSSGRGCGTRCGIRTPISSAVEGRGASCCLSCIAGTRPRKPDPEQQALDAVALERALADHRGPAR